MRRWFIYGAFFLSSLSANEPHLRIGEPFSHTITLSIPKEAESSLRSYLLSISYNRPLPLSFFLESFHVRNNTITLHGRMSLPGKHTISLGLFQWERSRFDIPSFTVSTISPIPLVSSQFLTPFPEIHASQTLQREQKKLLAINQEKGTAQLKFRNFYKNLTVTTIFLLICSPLIQMILQSYDTKKAPQPLSISFRIKEIERKRKKTVPWTDLLQLLNHIHDPTRSYTAYDLIETFAKKDATTLAKVATLIEKFGYQKTSHRKVFDHAWTLTKKEISQKKEKNSYLLSKKTAS